MPVNHTIILLQFRIRHTDLTVIEAYAPTEEAEDSVNEEFYYAIEATLDTASRYDFKILMGDFYAKTGKESDVWGNLRLATATIMESLMEIFCNNNLSITNTHFRQKSSHRNTWQSLDGKTCNLIDYMITRNERLTSFCVQES